LRIIKIFTKNIVLLKKQEGCYYLLYLSNYLFNKRVHFFKKEKCSFFIELIEETGRLV
jgi:hypothetical protein